MSTGSTDYSDPQYHSGRAAPLAVAPLADSLTETSDIWAEIHGEVQRILESLDEPLRSMVPHIRVQPGSTHGRSFYLFTYRSFSRTDATDVDPVVVGITFTPTDEGRQVVIDSDISGEFTGDCVKALALQTIPATRDELLRAANALAHELSGYTQQVAEALLDLAGGRLQTR